MIFDKLKHTRDIGEATEEIAFKYLKEKGLKLITKNFSQRCGEIDLIMQHQNNIVFIEVKYRKNINFGYPEETVTIQKQNKIKTTALLFISKNSKYKNNQPRFDIIAMLPTSGNMSINWIKNAF